MARRRRNDQPRLADWHLWTEVTRTVAPLRPDAAPPMPELDTAPPPAAQVPAMAPKPAPRLIAMPSYKPDGRPSRTPREGIEPGIRQRLVRGRIAIDGTIDLHGMRQSEAHAALSRFIHARAARGDRTLLVITGKGGRVPLRDEDLLVSFERGVLRGMLPIWLSSPDLAPLVAGWDSAVQGHGGDGAFYVRLKAPGRIPPGRVKP